MKKMMFTLVALLTIAASANAMSYEQARNEALFLTDKMAYELNLSDDQYEAAYEINLDYLMGVTSQYDVFGPYWERRNLDLSYILFSWQWDMFRAASYFYRPLYWNAGYWHFGIYARYPHRDYFYFGRPHFYASYRGGHSWRMNGGRSFYEGRRDFYRPVGHTRDNHFGMRNGFDRGDYRGGRVAGGSSTRHTQGGAPGTGDFGRGHQGTGSSGYQNGQRGGQQTDRGGFGSNRRSSSTGSNTDRPAQNNGGTVRGTTPQVQRSIGAERMQVAPQVQQQRSVSADRMQAVPQQRSSSAAGSFGGSRSSSGSAGSVHANPTRSSSGSGASTSGSRSSSGSRGSFGGSRR